MHSLLTLLCVYIKQMPKNSVTIHTASNSFYIIHWKVNISLLCWLSVSAVQVCTGLTCPLLVTDNAALCTNHQLIICVSLSHYCNFTVLYCQVHSMDLIQYPSCRIVRVIHWWQGRHTTSSSHTPSDLTCSRTCSIFHWCGYVICVWMPLHIVCKSSGSLEPQRTASSDFYFFFSTGP